MQGGAVAFRGPCKPRPTFNGMLRPAESELLFEPLRDVPPSTCCNGPVPFVAILQALTPPNPGATGPFCVRLTYLTAPYLRVPLGPDCLFERQISFTHATRITTCMACRSDNTYSLESRCWPPARGPMPSNFSRQFPGQYGPPRKSG